jgi:signal transduction histidine kinase
VAGWAKLAEVVAAEAVTTWQHLARQGRLLLAWWLFLPATAVVTAVINVPGQPATAIGLLVAAVALLCRFTWPITSLLAGTGVAAVALILQSTTLLAFIWPVSVMLAYAVGRQVTETRLSVAALALATGVQSAASLVDLAGLTVDLEDVGRIVVINVLLVVLPAAIGMRQGERALTMDALQERNALLERANLLGESQARMQERARIAGEMHDLLGHRLSLIVLYAGALEMRTRTAAPEVNEQADLLRTTSRTALEELRAVLGILRLDGAEPPDGTESAVGTREDVTNLVAEAQHAGLPITLSWRGGDLTDADIGIGIRRAVNRIVREALTNVHKHAPGAPTRLTVTVDTDKLTLHVLNVARPPAVPPPSSGLGLVGLRERARLAGGDFTAGTDPLTGNHALTATLPLRHDSPGTMSPTIDQPAPVDAQMLPSRTGADDGPHHDASRRKTKTAFLTLAGATVAVCGGLGFGVYDYFQSAVSPHTYRQIKIGDTQHRVRELTGGDNMTARTAVQAEQPAAPAGTSCEYALAEGFGHVFRFCFTHGKLAQKDELGWS